MLAICGGGSGGHALAVVASACHEGEIVWLISSDEKARRLRQGAFSDGGLRATGVMTAAARRLRVISSDPAEVIPRAELVILVLPAYGHRQVLERIRPYLRADALLGVVPARAGLEFELGRALPGAGAHGHWTVFGLQTLPWLCRVREVGQLVDIKGIKSRVLAATLPGGAATSLSGRLTTLFGTEIVPVPNFLNLTLGNPGQVIHVGGMYALFGRCSARTYRSEEIPGFYDGLDKRAAALIESLSREVVAIARAIEEASGGTLDLSGALPIDEWLRLSYPSQIGDATSLLSCIRTNSAYRGVTPPMRELSPGVFAPDFGHRFLAEDVPYGIAVVRAFAELVGVGTPVIDEVIEWAQEKLGKQYLVDGKLRGRDVGALRIPQNCGLHSVRALVQIYV